MRLLGEFPAAHHRLKLGDGFAGDEEFPKHVDRLEPSVAAVAPQCCFRYPELPPVD